MLDKIRTKLGEQVDGSSLAIFRIAFGLAVFWSVLKYVMPGSEAFRVFHVLPAMNFPYVGWEWVKPVPLPLLKAVYVILALGCLMMALGLFHRIAATVVFLTYTYTFLLESSLFNNHFYLISLISFLLIWMPADARFSMRALLSTRQAGRVPYWSVFVLRFQLLVVYVYGGIAKFNADFLSGEAIIGSAQIFKDQLVSVMPSLEFVQAIHIGIAMAWIGLFFDLFIGFILWARKTQWIGLILLAFFHGINQLTLPIGVFPFLGFMASTIFLAPNWPVASWRWVMARLGRADSPGSGGDLPSAASVRPSSPVLCFVAAWMLFQLLLPLRHFAIPGDPSWTEEGQNFAWRMMLRQKAGGNLVLHVKDQGMFRDDSNEPRIDWSRVPSDPACQGVFVGIDASRISWSASSGINTIYENVIGFRIIQAVKADDEQGAKVEMDELRQWWSSKTESPGLFLEALPLRECVLNAIERLQELGDPDAGTVGDLLRQVLELQAKSPGLIESEVRKNLLQINDLLYYALQTKYADVLRPELVRIRPFELLGVESSVRFYVLAESRHAEGIQAISAELDRGDHFLIWCDFEKLRNYAWRDLPLWFVIYESGKLMVLWNYFPELNRRQSEHLITKPYMIHQYAQRIASRWQNETGRRPVIHGHGVVMMNYRKPQSLFYPDVDLASVPYHLWRHNEWIRPLRSERIGIAERVAREAQRLKKKESEARR